ncbi:MAG: site-2 protease family protein, partial [bacterium]|nr:site-2 protease family protein [bacterium]MDY4100656.1 site-2 protease family protein [Lachnospiraceae bacterium]
DTYTASKPDGIFYIVINMLNMAILLSANLGVMNLLPLPALDGGRLVFFIIEAIRGKRMDPQKEGMVHYIGLIALMIFMVVIMGNDIRKLFM